MSFKTEVQADYTKTWRGNGLRFATKDEAEAYVGDLQDRWTSVYATRVVEVDEPVTHEWLDGRLEWLAVKQSDLDQPDARVQGAFPKFDS